MRTTRITLAVAATALLFTGCDWVSSLFGGAGANRPPIPEPDSYLAEVPLRSDELVVATVPLTNFTPRVTRALDDEGNEIATASADEWVPLVINGNPAPNPQFQGQPTQPLEESPQLQLVRYWQRVGPVERYSGATTTSIERSVTRGSETTRTESFAWSVGVSTTVTGGSAFVQASATVSTEFSGETSSEYTISQSVTETETYEVAAGQDENLVFAVWQLVDEYRVVVREGGEWVTFNDPGYEFREEDFEGLPVPVDDIRNISYRFPNNPRAVDVE